MKQIKTFFRNITTRNMFKHFIMLRAHYKNTNQPNRVVKNFRTLIFNIVNGNNKLLKNCVNYNQHNKNILITQ